MWPHEATIIHENTEKEIKTTIILESSYHRMRTKYKYEIRKFLSTAQLNSLDSDFVDTYHITIYRENFNVKFEKINVLKGFPDWTSALVSVYAHFDSQMRKK